jgi:hypothetical protein
LLDLLKNRIQSISNNLEVIKETSDNSNLEEVGKEFAFFFFFLNFFFFYYSNGENAVEKINPSISENLDNIISIIYNSKDTVK